MISAYFDCFSGISGDMILGALLDLGLSLDTLESELKKVPLEGFDLVAGKVMRARVQATKFTVRAAEAKPRSYAEIVDLIERSELDEDTKGQGKQIFRALAEAEAKIHGQAADAVHFHEVGAVDSIVDILGAVIGLRLLNVGQVLASEVALCDPAPATLELLKETPVYGIAAGTEITTPTGAAILAHFAGRFGPIPAFSILATGYGAGTQKLKGPNVLRIILGEDQETGFEEVRLLETNVDNTNPQLFEHVMAQLFEAGALDVWLDPVVMKKNRPAVVICVLSPVERVAELAEILFAETDTLGIRISPRDRIKAHTRMVEVETEYGRAVVKIGEFKGNVVSAVPEYESCRKLANKLGVPLKAVLEAARAASSR